MQLTRSPDVEPFEGHAGLVGQALLHLQWRSGGRGWLAVLHEGGHGGQGAATVALEAQRWKKRRNMELIFNYFAKKGENMLWIKKNYLTKYGKMYDFYLAIVSFF